MDNYLTVKDFAAAAGVTTQAIYKRIRNENDTLSPYVKEVEGITMISADVLPLISGSKQTESSDKEFPELDLMDIVNKTNKTAEKKDKQAESPDISIDAALDLCEILSEYLSDQLTVKDKQIAEKDKQILELTQLVKTLTEANNKLVEAMRDRR